MLNKIRTKEVLHCKCCHSEGIYLYQSLQDRLFGVDGKWSVKQCVNQQCGLLWLDPMPIEEDLHKAYENYYTHVDQSVAKKSLMSKATAGYKAYKYGFMLSETNPIQRLLGRAFSLFGFLKEHMDYPFVHFKDLPKGKLLELGSGSGDTLKLFKAWGWQAEGLDFDAKAVENASGKGLLVHQGDIFSQKFENNNFDAIFSSHVFEHVPDPEALLNESYRALKSGGVFVAVMPNSNSKLHKFFKSNWRELDPPRHLNIFSPIALHHLVKKTKFKSFNITTGNYSATGVYLMSHAIAQDGKADMFARSSLRSIAHLIHFYLGVTHRFSPLSGEELILVARK